MRRINVLAVVVSWVVDIGGSNLAGLAYLAWAATTQRIDQRLLTDQRALLADREVSQALLVLGLIVSVIAGFVGARIAGRSHLLYGFLSSVAALAFVPFSLSDALRTQPLGLVVAGLVGGPVAGIAGGLIASRMSAGATAADALA